MRKACLVVLVSVAAGEMCADSSSWFTKKKAKRDCAWVGKDSDKVESRCKKKADDRISGWEACPLSCGECEDPTSATASGAVDRRALFERFCCRAGGHPWSGACQGRWR